MKETSNAAEKLNLMGGGNSLCINKLRFLLVFGVVFIHNFGEPNYGKVSIYDIQQIDYHTLFDILRIGIHRLSKLSVPCFYMISGYLFYIGIQGHKEEFLKKWRKRINSLIMPYIIWNIIFTLWHFLLNVKGHVYEISDFFQYIEMQGWFHIFWDSSPRPGQTGAPEDMPLWFLRDLIVVVFILSPIIYRLLKSKQVGLTYLMLLFVVGAIGIFPIINGLSIEALKYFSLGAFLSIHSISFVDLATKYKRITIPVFIISYVLLVYFKGSDYRLYGVSDLFVLSGIAIMVYASTGFSKKITGQLSILQKASFFVFASHMLFLGICRGVIQKISFGDVYISYLVPPFITIALCTAMYFIINKYLPKVSIIINGR